MNNSLLAILLIVYIIIAYSNIVLLKTIYMKHKKINIQLNKISVNEKEQKNNVKKFTYVGLIGNIGRTIYEYYEQLDPDIQCNLN